MFDFLKRAKEFTPGISTIRNLFVSKLTGSNNDLVERYNGWAYRSISLTAQEVSSAYLRVYRKGRGKENDVEVPNHEFLNVWNNPNPEMSRGELLEHISSFLDLDGNSYLLRAKAGNKTKELWPLRSDWVKVIASEDKERLVKGYVYYNGKDNVPLEVDEVVQIRQFNPKFFNDLKGKGGVEAAKSIIDEDNTIREWNRKFFENGAVTSGVLEYDGVLKDEQKKRIETNWRKQNEGTDNVGKTPILSGGLKYKQTQLSQKELAFIEQRKLDRDDIFLMFGVPKGLMMSEDIGKENAKQALWSFTRFTVAPRLKKIADAINQTVMKEYGEEFYVAFDNPVPEDRESKVSEYAQGVNKWLTPNDIRKEEGLEEIDGGDELRSASPLVPAIDPNAKRAKKKDVKAVPEKKMTEREERGEKAWGEMLKVQTPYEDKYKNDLKKYFNGLATRVLQKIDSVKSAKSNSLIDEEEETNTLVDILTPLQRELLETQGKRALKELGLENDFVITPSISKVLDKYNIRLAKRITRVTREDLQELVSSSQEDGESVQVLAEKISQYFGDTEETRSLRIARTETIRTSNQALEDAWTQSGVVDAKEWYTSQDERVCPYCDEVDGAVINLGEDFYKKGESVSDLTLDFRDIGEPPLHANCRCVLLPVLK